MIKHSLGMHRVIAAPVLILAAALGSCSKNDNTAMPRGDSTPPSPVTDLVIIAAGDSTITIQWTAPGDDGQTGTAASYEIRWSHAIITGNNFASANLVTSPPAPEIAGTVQHFTIAGIDNTLVTYLAMIARDEVANASPFSNNTMWTPHDARLVKNIPPFKDNSTYEEGDTLSNGALPYLITGSLERSSRKVLRRALIAFAVSDSIPAGAVIDSVQLMLHESGAHTGEPRTTSLHRVTADWGEGTSDSGGSGSDGAPAVTGDATWLYRFFDTAMWTTPGGDFVAGASAARKVSYDGNYIWKSTPQMTSDVQSWLDTPASNFGWVILGDESGAAGTAKRFDSRENPDAVARPVLKVFYTIP